MNTRNKMLQNDRHAPCARALKTHSITPRQNRYPGAHVKKILCAALVALFAAATPAMANHGARDLALDDWQHRLEQRIDHGWRSGELTRHEYRRLRGALRDIERAERVYWSDGHLSPRERNELHARLDWLSREIYRQKHDVERRYESYNHGFYDHHAYRRY